MIRLLSSKFTRLLLVLALCLIGFAIITGTFVLAQNKASDPAVHWPGVIEPGNPPSGDVLNQSNAVTGVAGVTIGAAPAMLTTTPVATIYLPIVMGSGSGNPPSGDTLSDGSVFIGVDGVTIGAVSGTLTSTLAVTIAQTTAPTLTLPGGAQPHGSYYSLRAERDVNTFGSSTFILGLPVPTGVMTDHLGIAVYDLADGEDPAGWFILPGRYDTSSELMLVALPSLVQQARTAVLVSHPGLQSPRNDPAAAVMETALAIAVSAGQFEVLCVIQDDALFNLCLNHKDLVEKELNEIHGDLKSIGYPDPLLYTQADAFNINPPTILQSTTYVAIVRSDGEGCVGEPGLWGFYRQWVQQLVFCVAPFDPLPPGYSLTIRHEYYHAVQSGFPATWDDKNAGRHERWLTEGTATAVENENTTGLGIYRSPDDWQLHKIDRPLKSKDGDDEYEAQDFWVFLGQASGSGLDRFIALFQQGATTEDVANWIGSMDGFKNWYWRWVKNQVMVEENITFDNQLGQPCTLQTQTVETLRSWDFYNGDGFGYPGELPPLTSHVIKLVIDSELEGLGRLGVWEHYAQMGDPDIRYKVYVDSETCTSIPDGFRYLYDITTTKDYYIVVSNVNPDATKPYLILLD